MSVSPSELTFVGIMKTDGTVRQQDNSIELAVTEDPAASGCAYWDWVVDQADITGFDGASRSISFVYDYPGDTKKLRGKIVLTGFDTADWDNDGQFTIQLKNPSTGMTMHIPLYRRRPRHGNSHRSGLKFLFESPSGSKIPGVISFPTCTHSGGTPALISEATTSGV